MKKFKELVAKLEGKGMNANEAGAVAYKAGVKKYGKRSMLRKAATGRRKAEQ